MTGTLNNKQDLANNTASRLIGLEISEAAKMLGYWWVLENQNIGSSGSQYNFTRAGAGKVTLYTNEKNIVVKTSANNILSEKNKNKTTLAERLEAGKQKAAAHGAERKTSDISRKNKNTAEH